MSDLIGQRHNRWTIIARCANARRVQARCDCGDVHVVFLQNVVQGRSKQCRECFLIGNRERRVAWNSFGFGWKG